MLTVIGVVTVLFVLATMLLSMAVYQITSTSRQEYRTKAVHMADAGLNAYLYELRRNPLYWSTNPTVGPVAYGDGSWSVSAVSASGTVIVRSVGTIPSRSTSRTVMAQVRFPTFADYMFLANADINIGADAIIDGKLRSNGNVNNLGIVKGKVYAGGTVTGSRDSSHLLQGYLEHQPLIDFATVTTDLTAMRAVAVSSGHQFGASGYSGWLVAFSGSQYRVYKVTGGTSTGYLTTTLYRDYTAIPAQGVVYFDDNVWVQGNYSSMVTVGCGKTAYIPDNLVPTAANTPYTCGIIAQKDIIVPTWYPNLPTNMTITAAMLAQTGAVYGELQTGHEKNSLVINGSMAYTNYGYFAQYSGSDVTAGFNTRAYNYDPRLDLFPPPMFPTVKDGSLKVTSWIEQ
jgi:hypothetical protein